MNSHWKLIIVLMLGLGLVTVGCNSGETNSSVSEMEALADQLDAEAKIAELEAIEKAKLAEAIEAQKKAEALAATEATVAANKNALGRRQARSGGYLGAVAKGRLSALRGMENAQVTQALNLYWGSTGEYPKSHDEFMTKVIQANGISLEQLEEPYEYWYNPEDYTLYTRVKPEAIEAAEAEAEAAEQ